MKSDAVLTLIESSPSCNISVLSDVIFIVLRDADGNHIGLEDDGLVKSEQRQIVLEGARVKLRVAGHDLHSALKVGVCLGLGAQIVLSQSQQQIGRRHATKDDWEMSQTMWLKLLRRVHVYNFVVAAGIWDERCVEMPQTWAFPAPKSAARNTLLWEWITHSRLTTRKPTAVTTINKEVLQSGIFLTGAKWSFGK